MTEIFLTFFFLVSCVLCWGLIEFDKIITQEKEENKRNKEYIKKLEYYASELLLKDKNK